MQLNKIHLTGTGATLQNFLDQTDFPWCLCVSSICLIFSILQSLPPKTNPEMYFQTNMSNFKEVKLYFPFSWWEAATSLIWPSPRMDQVVWSSRQNINLVSQSRQNINWLFQSRQNINQDFQSGRGAALVAAAMSAQPSTCSTWPWQWKWSAPSCAIM